MIRKMLFALTLSLCLASGSLAEVRAEIDGPTQAKPGDLVVLSAADSIGDGFRWVSPEGVQTLQCSGDLAFASGTPGDYRFLLIAADNEANIDYATHVVTIVGSQPQPDPDPDPGEPDPDPQPTPGAWEELRKISASGAKSLADPSTAEKLARAIKTVDAQLEQLCQARQCPTITQASQTMVQAIEGVLALRRGASLQADWLGKWRRPINAHIKAKNPADLDTYRAAMRAVAVGLSESLNDG